MMMSCVTLFGTKYQGGELFLTFARTENLLNPALSEVFTKCQYILPVLQSGRVESCRWVMLAAGPELDLS